MSTSTDRERRLRELEAELADIRKNIEATEYEIDSLERRISREEFVLRRRSRQLMGCGLLLMALLLVIADLLFTLVF